jgi:serine/threonine protein kinase
VLPTIPIDPPPGENTRLIADPGGGATPPPSAAFAGLRYQPVRLHRRGGQGEVFVARDEELHRDVALKRIQPRPTTRGDAVGRFVREAEVTGRLEHPGVVPVYGLGRDADGRPYYAMRFVQGESFDDAIRRFHADPGNDPRARSVAFRHLLTRFLAVCDTAAYAHSRGVVHRDLKPQNVMLGAYGETLVVDWGLAKLQSEAGEPAAEAAPAGWDAWSETATGSVFGTPAYMSPEQAAGRISEVGPASDVYSLGAFLYSLLTGRVPIDADAPEVIDRVRRGDITPPRRLVGASRRRWRRCASRPWRSGPKTATGRPWS